MFDLTYKYVADHDLLLRAFYSFDIPTTHVDEIWVRMRSGGVTGSGWRGLVEQNKEIRRAQRKYGIQTSLLTFIITKVSDRLYQKFLGFLYMRKKKHRD